MVNLETWEAINSIRVVREFDDRPLRVQQLEQVIRDEQEKLVDDEQDYLLYHPVDDTWTTRLTYQDPADNEWYDQEQLVDTISELVELYNPADIFAWLRDVYPAVNAWAELVEPVSIASE